MENENTKGKLEFLFSHVVWGVISWLWYKELLFKCLGNHTKKESLFILAGLILLGCVTGIYFQMKKKRNSVSVFMNLVAGYGLYVVLAYFTIKKKLMLIMLLVFLVLTVASSLLVITQKIKNPRMRKGVVRRRIGIIGRASRKYFCICLACIMTVLIGDVIFRGSLVSPTVGTPTQANLEKQTIANNMDTLLLLQEDKWQTLSVEEKINVLQVIANIEQRYLGLPNELNVCTSNLRDNLSGYYADTSHEIMIDLDLLLNDTSRSAVNTLLHEAYHSHQHRVVDVYNGADENLKDLLFFYDATKYKKEFANYEDGENDIKEYYLQKCEIDARRYAQSATQEYFDRIRDYLKENAAEDVSTQQPEVKISKYPFEEDVTWYSDQVGRYVGDNGLIGYVNTDGTEITPPMFLDGSNMRSGIALVRTTEDHVYYINSEGKRITQDYVDGETFDYEGNYAIVKTEDGLYSLINRQGEEFFSGADDIEGFSINDNIGTAVVNGHAVMLRLSFEEGISCSIEREFPEYGEISYFMYGLFTIVGDGKGNYGVITRQGEEIIPVRYASVDYDAIYNENNDKMILFKLEKADGTYEFKNHLFRSE